MTVRYRLENGLTVVFEEQHAAKVAAFQVWVNVGSADERLDQAGLAHLHEHMLFKGTASRGPGEIARDIESHGGEINAWTSFDQTVYHIVIASQFAERGLDILGDAVRFSAFDPEELAREIEVVCEEIKRSEDSPGRRSSKDLFATAYQRHPYLRPVIGTETSVRSFTREKVLEFYRRHYTPQNMVLAVAGDLSEAQLRKWTEKIFGGDWGRPFPGREQRLVEPPLTRTRTQVREDDVREAYLNLGFPIPAADHPDTPALDLLAMVAGQGEASRLSLEVKRKRSLVNDIHAYAYTPKDPGLMGVSITAPAQQLEAALEQTVRVLAQLKAAPIPADELATVKAIVESQAVYGRETVQGLARKLGYYEAALGGIEHEARYYEQIAGLSAEQLREAAQKYFIFDKAILTGLVPPGTAFTGADAESIVARVAKEAPQALPGRKAPPAEVAAPMRVTAPLSARKGESGIVIEKLPSGATVIVREESAVPLFAMRAVFPGGLRYETEADNGLTTLLARMLTRGTPTNDAEQISHLIDDLAGSVSGSGGRNSMSLRGEFLSRHFARGFDLFTDCLLNASFPEAELQREKQLTLQDIATREDKPSGLAFDLFAKTLYQVHPYRMNSSGEAASVERLTPQMLSDYRDAYLDPSQLTLCVVGDVKVDQVLAFAHQAFGKARGKAKAPPAIPHEPPLESRRVSRLPLARAQSHLVLGFPGLTVTDPDRQALEVLSTVLSGQGGRLFVELRDKRSMAYSVSSFAMEGVDPGYFAVYMGTSPEKLEAALEGIRAELIRIRDEPLPAVELENAKQHLIGTHEIGLQRNGSRAALMALDHCYGIGAADFLNYASKISVITADEVREVARKVIDFNRSVLTVVGPPAAAGDVGAAEGDRAL